MTPLRGHLNDAKRVQEMTQKIGILASIKDANRHSEKGNSASFSRKIKKHAETHAGKWNLACFMKMPKMMPKTPKKEEFGIF